MPVLSVEKGEKLEYVVTVEIPPEQVEQEREKFLQEYTKTARVPGFRPGKPVPLRIIKQMYGKEVHDKAVAHLLPKSLFEALEQKALKPAGMPTVEMVQNEADKPIQFAARFEVYPEFEVTDLAGHTVDKKIAEVTEADVDGALEKILAQHKTWKDVKRAAQAGDQITIDFLGTLDGEPFEGGKVEGVDIELGAGRMIPGFEEQLIGAEENQSLTISVTFPENYGHQPLAGKSAEFAIKVHRICEPKLPELNDEFAKKLNIIEGGVEKLREEVKRNMQQDLEQRLLNMNKEVVFNKLLEANTFDIPQSLVQREIEQMREETLGELRPDKTLLAGKLPHLPDALFQEQAERRVRLGLLVSAYIHQHEVKINDAMIDERLEKIANIYKDPQGFIKACRDDKKRMKEIAAVLMEELAVEKLLATANVVDQQETFDAIVNPSATPEDQ